MHGGWLQEGSSKMGRAAVIDHLGSKIEFHEYGAREFILSPHILLKVGACVFGEIQPIVV